MNPGAGRRAALQEPGGSGPLHRVMGIGYGLQVDVLTKEGGAPGGVGSAVSPRRVRPSVRLGVLVCAAVLLVGVGTWLWDDLTSRPSVYVIGDSITSLSQTSISSVLTDAGYRPTISATPGARIGQAQTNIATLAQNQPWAWIVELGTDDAGAGNASWPQPFLAEWTAVAPARCVVYVTVSPRAGPVGAQINASIERLAQAHQNVHVLDWGQEEYANPTWVASDGIHPTSEGQVELAELEQQDLQRDC